MSSMTRGLNRSPTYRGVTSYYPDPFVTIASLLTPQTMPHLLRMDERLCFSNSMLAAAIRRVISFLVTKIDISDCSDEEKNAYQDYLEETVHITNSLHLIAFDYVCYGNSFISILRPFTRYLFCKNCNKIRMRLREVHGAPKMNYRFENWTFKATCPLCKVHGEWVRHDVEEKDQQSINIKRWSPHYMEVKYVETTGKKFYYWRFNENEKQRVKEGDIDYLIETPWPMIEAIKRGMWLKLNEDRVLHLSMEAPAGWRTGGWGVSPLLVLFPDLYQVQVMRRSTEMLCHENILPIKIISPQATSKAGVPGNPNIMDPSIAMNLGGQFTGLIQQILNYRRVDPMGYSVMPFPVNFQQLTGDAKNLIPKDIMDQAYDYVLNALNVPVDFYKGSLTIQAAPVALRTVQSGWSHLTMAMNKVLDFVMREVALILSVEPAKARLAKPSDIDDINRVMARLNLMAAGKISDTSGMDTIGMSQREEIDRQMADQRYIMQKQKEFQKEMEREGLTDMLNQGMVPPQGGQQGGGQGQDQQQQQQMGPPPISNPQAPKTPEQQYSDAQAWATFLIPLSQQNKTQYNQYLRQLRTQDPVTHTMTMAIMEQTRENINNQAGQQAMAQQFGGGKSAKAVKRVSRYDWAARKLVVGPCRNGKHKV